MKLSNHHVREVINNLFMDSKFTDKSSNLAKGKIKKDFIFETDQRLISKNDRNKVIIEDTQEIVIFKTLRVPLVLQRGHPKFIKLLS